MAINKEFEKIGNLFNKKTAAKPPAYQWQDLALRIINELAIPNFKRSSVFKICKEKPKNFIESCLNDTKELCKTGDKWKYFFKIVGQGTQIYK
ncbi:hypothetical protein KKC83_06705 [Patescibacteria group bacterium]|nr:hypothetical protein [Candidatus Falkowbacteria bacterium]MBU3905850.1 hypothetical protein [Patescibacteria group bacterium]MCG2698700.1 hypothetical protein [Candidatus Parcubacteria bacterium]MBU4015266.1 hypothetical protein [Patescibacteria group bacterium]MBU4027203.1 hypothetical protein [Patescibacteria group bacterium]